MNVRRRAGAVVVALALAFPTAVVAAGPAHAAPGRPTPAAAPASDVLALLGDVLARLLPVPGLAPAPGPAPAIREVAASTVRVSGVACGRRLFGSGFSPAPDTIVTNAHVVAGTRGAEVLRPDGRTLAATVVAFDPALDLAVLAVPGLGQPSLPLGTAVVGETGAVYGHPFGRAALEVSPAQVLRRVNVDAGDIYDRPSVPRQILVLGANLDPGDSGGAFVNRAGQVVGVAFAVSNLRRGTAFAVAAEELAPVLARPRSAPVSTGPCLR